MNAADPIPVIPLEYAKAPLIPRLRRWVLVGRVALVVAATDLVIGWILIPAVDAGSVVITAPILFAAGAVLIVASWKLKLTLGAILGLTHCSICLLFTMLVNVRRWSPNDATLPFTLMGGAYTLGVAFPLSVFIFRRMREMAAGKGTA